MGAVPIVTAAMPCRYIGTILTKYIGMNANENQLTSC